MYMKERGNMVLALGVVVGLALIFFVVGYFRNTGDAKGFLGAINYKLFLRLPCGLTTKAPVIGQRVAFPLTVTGFANECGWSARNGSAGTVQVFDAKGLPVTKPSSLSVAPTELEKPYRFEATLTVLQPPSTETGHVLLTSDAGLVHSIPVAF